MSLFVFGHRPAVASGLEASLQAGPKKVLLRRIYSTESVEEPFVTG